MQLSKNFHLAEFLRSQTAARLGIDNGIESGSAVEVNLRALSERLLQPIRDGLGPVHVTSGYRCPALNKAIGGSASSAHSYGRAADIVVTGYSPHAVCAWVIDQGLAFDQLIHEFGQWTHIAIARCDNKSRRQILTATRQDGQTIYQPGLHRVPAKEGRPKGRSGFNSPPLEGRPKGRGG